MRKIRISLINSGSVQKYLLYAVGEIVYCGRYEFNEEESLVSNLWDVIAIKANTEHEVFVRDYEFTDDNQLLILSPREDTWLGTSLTWKRVQ